jgi:hypothetical protein
MLIQKTRAFNGSIFFFLPNFRQTALVGTLQVPATGVQLSKPVGEDVPGFTLDMPATTISYSYNLSATAASKLQALLDAFNEVFNVTANNGGRGNRTKNHA